MVTADLKEEQMVTIPQLKTQCGEKGQLRGLSGKPRIYWEMVGSSLSLPKARKPVQKEAF